MAAAANGNDILRAQRTRSPMSTRPDGGVEEHAAAGASAPVAFDDNFRARLRDLLVWRRDVRRFRRDPLPCDAVESLIELASLAPSVGLSQPWRFVIVESETARAAVRQNFAMFRTRGALRAAQARRDWKRRLATSRCSPIAQRRKATASDVTPCRR